MKALSALLGALILFTGCSKSATVDSKNYSGTFVLTSPLDVPLQELVNINFSGVNFSGRGDSSAFPFVGTGVFKLNGDSIYFTQTGPVPSISGRGAILEGAFLLEKNNDSLVFTRKSTTGVLGPEQFYRLKLQ